MKKRFVSGTLVRQLPMRLTIGLTALLVLLPAARLLQQPRIKASGLARLLHHAALLQSFQTSPQRPVPQFWLQHLSREQAEALWRQQPKPWWRMWGRDGGHGAFLVFFAPVGNGSAPEQRPPHSLRVGDLVVVASGPLSKRLLEDQLQSAASQPLSAIQQQCFERLQRQQAVYWSPNGLSSMAGPLAPLFYPWREGCLQLKLVNSALMLDGLVAPASGVPSSDQPLTLPADPAPLASDQLIELSGPALDPLLQGFLGRQLIRDPLASAYGLGEARLALVRRSRFRITLRQVSSGSFQAGLELLVRPSGKPVAWQQLLEGLAAGLEARGLERVPGSATLWRDRKSKVVGGWRWLGPPQRQLLQLFVGPQPPTPSNEWLTDEVWQRLTTLQLRARPEALAGLDLIPQQAPSVLMSAEDLQLYAQQGLDDQGATFSRLLGRLQVTRSPAVPAPK